MTVQSWLDKRACILVGVALCACSPHGNINSEPKFSNDFKPSAPPVHFIAPDPPESKRAVASLWAGQQGQIFGDNRAQDIGDIMTVVIEIDDKAEISNQSTRGRTADQGLGLDNFLGIPQRLSPEFPPGFNPSDAIDVRSRSSHSGEGRIRRNEKLTLRVAATVTEVLPNGVLMIVGTQEVRVNYELRELTVQGYVRPSDVSRQNEITYDKIAAAQISYGGRGHISEVQKPRYGQQVIERVLPF